jgi:hypothetical protein
MITKTPFTAPIEVIENAKMSMMDVDFRTSLNEPSDRFFYDSWVIKKEFEGTAWETILNTLPSPIGEARIIKLQHGTCYMSHCDIDDRYHLNIEGQYSFLIDIDSQRMYQTTADGYWYIMDTGIHHVAANFGSIDRLQLVVRQLLNDADLNDPVSVEIRPICENPRFEFDDIVSPWLNKINKLYLLKNFTVFKEGVRFQIEREILKDLDLFSKEKFNIVVEK